MPSDKLTPYHHTFRHRLSHILAVSKLRKVQLAQEYSAQYTHSLSDVSISHWLSGRRIISPHLYPGLKTILASHLLMATDQPKFGLEQEMLDWDGLVFNDDQLKRERKRPKPLIIGDLPRSSPGTGHFYRKTIRDQIIMKLLNPNQNGLFQPGIVVLTGIPGSGKSEMILEVLERVLWFFNGGILFADLSRSHKVTLQEWGQNPMNYTSVLREINAEISKHQGRWLLVVENLNDGQRLRAILPTEDIWVLATSHGIAALQPLGWERFIFPLPLLTEEESQAWLKLRLDDHWGKTHNREYARQLHRLVEGLPMGIAILSALVRSRGWELVIDAMQDPQRAVSYIRYGSGLESPISSLATALDMAFHSLAAAEKLVLRELALYAPGNSIPEELFWF